MVSIEILTDNGVFSSSINNQFEFIEPPIITNVKPHIAPIGFENVELYVKGGVYDPAYEYFCQFRVKHTFLNETKAFFVTNKKIKCIIPGGSMVRHPGYVNVKVVMKDLSKTFSY